MSCFIMNDSALSALADFIGCLLNHGYNYFSFPAPAILHIELNDCNEHGSYQEEKIYNRLYSLNVAAYRGRYPEETVDYWPDYKENIKYKPTTYGPMNPDDERSGYTAQVQPWHFEMLNRLDCFLYQCAEDATYNTDLYKALKALQVELMRFICQHSTPYTAHKWGE